MTKNPDATLEMTPVSSRAQRLETAARFGVGILAVFFLTVLASLLVWAVVPEAFPGWTSSSVTSGSMEPRILVGDVVVSGPVDNDDIERNMVILFDTDNGLTLHRVADVEENSVVTKGDANQSVDVRPVPFDQVRGQGKYLVPWIGMPVRWRMDGDWRALAALALGIIVALYTTRWTRLATGDIIRYRPPYDARSLGRPERETYGLLPEITRRNVLQIAHGQVPARPSTIRSSTE